jgi:hypothetical protein
MRRCRNGHRGYLGLGLVLTYLIKFSVTIGVVLTMLVTAKKAATP